MFCFQTYSSTFCDKTTVCTPDKSLACFLFVKISLCVIFIAASFKIVLKCAYKRVDFESPWDVRFPGACVSISFVFVGDLIVMVFALKKLHWISYNYTCLRLSSIENRNSVQ